MPAGVASFAEALRAGAEIFHALRGILKGRGLSTGVGDEGGFAPSLKANREALDVVLEAIGKAGYKAGTRRVHRDRRRGERAVERRARTSSRSRASPRGRRSRWSRCTRTGCSQYPIVSIEDGHAENDWAGWKAADEGARRTRCSSSATTCSSPTRRSCKQGHRRGRRQRDPDQAQSDRHRHRDARLRRDGPEGRLRDDHLAPLGRDRGRDDRRPRRRHQRGPDQDGLGEPHRSRREVQPAAPHRGGARAARERSRARQAIKRLTSGCVRFTKPHA